MVASPSSRRLRRSFSAAVIAALTLGSSLLLAGVSAPSVLAGSKGDAVGPVEVSSAVYSDVSAPIRDLTGVAPAPSTDKGKKDKPLRPLPNRGNALRQADGALQTVSGPLVGTTAGLGFAGVGQGDYGFTDQYAPPDTNGAVGATQYVQWVNTYFAVFDKASGAIASGFPKPGNSIWAGFGGGCQTNNDGDPIVQYDKLANRWILTQFSVSTTPYLQCVAVSTTSDATGSYYRYAFTEPYFNDYPKLGVWPDGYYLSFNMFNGSSFAGARACALDRAKMLTGAAATQQCFQLSTSYGGLLPSDLDGTTAPPVGSPDYYLNYGANSLNLWKFHVDFTTPVSATFTGPTNIPVASFSAACGGGGTCIPQPGTANQLDSLADRLMYRLAYRNFGDHEALVVNHSVTVGGVTSVRWYELRGPGGTPSVFQQGTLSASDGTSRWMGSIAMDKAGDIALGYSASSSSVYPSIRYTGRVPGDPLGTMESETVIQSGTGYQATGLSRWGDYSAMSVDPVDDCTFWYTNEYLKSNGTWNWSTRIASFKFPGCGAAPPANDFSIGATPASLTLAQNTQGTSTISTAITVGTAQPVSLSVTGVPAGATGTFNPTSLTGAGSSTLTVSAGNATPGTYPLTITGTGTYATHSTIVSLTVIPPVSNGITNGGFETGNLTGWTASGTASVVGSGAHGGTYAAQVGATTPTNGDSSIAQTFIAPASATTLSFFYRVVCPDTVTYDWATATLTDITASGTATLLAKTCTNSGAWVQASGAVTAGHTYTLTLTSHDDNYATDPTYTLYDDVTLNAPPPADFTIGANPTTLSIAQGGSAPSSISTTQVGSPGTVGLAASVSPSASGVTASLSAASIAAGSGATLTVTVGSSAPTGPYTVTVTGTEGSTTHTATVAVTVTATSGKPGAPTLTATRASVSGVQLNWTIPANNGSALTGFNIYRSTASGAETFLTSISNPNSTSYRDTSTVSGRRYYYKITAVNGNGEGPLSNEASARAR